MRGYPALCRLCFGCDTSVAVDASTAGFAFDVSDRCFTDDVSASVVLLLLLQQSCGVCVRGCLVSCACYNNSFIFADIYDKKFALLLRN